jgi:hypothetical protein
MANKANTKPTHLKRKDVEPDPYLSRNEFKPEFYNQPSKRPITAETMYGKGTKRILEQEEISPDDAMMRYKKGGVAALDESDAHENKESKKQEARETRLEKKGYIETKSGKMKKPKKAFLGLAVQAASKSDNVKFPSLLGIGADKLLKNSETARNITSNLGMGGKMLSSYYSDLAGNKTEQQSTTPVKAYTGKAIKQPTETDTEFEIRHEYHTPFKGPQKAKDGVMIKNKSKKISTENTDDEYYPTGEGKEYPGGFMPEIRGTMPEGFKNPMEIKKGGLIKGKPRIAMKGWK